MISQIKISLFIYSIRLVLSSASLEVLDALQFVPIIHAEESLISVMEVSLILIIP